MPQRVKCPQCGELTPYEGNPWRPFCSERCKMIDLGTWAEGGYALPTEDTPGDDEGER
ncbi:MAG TPA: DNA gyrase inhibitor YacG [bacterium]|nr:DNA gyrase inhibitor YacG [bacterium]